MGRFLRQTQIVIRNVKNILTAKETASVRRWGSSFTVFFCSVFVCSYDSAAQDIFVSKKRCLA